MLQGGYDALGVTAAILVPVLSAWIVIITRCVQPTLAKFIVPDWRDKADLRHRVVVLARQAT